MKTYQERYLEHYGVKGFRMKTYQERYLEHYGVKGMRWGHRKDGAPQGTVGWRYSKSNRAERAKANLKEARKGSKSRERDARRPGGITYTSELKGLSRSEKKKRIARNKEVWKSEMDRTRRRVKSGDLKADVKQAKAQYKYDKLTKSNLPLAKAKYKTTMKELRNERAFATQYRDGKEVVIGTLAIAGGMALYSISVDKLSKHM